MAVRAGFLRARLIWVKSSAMVGSDWAGYSGGVFKGVLV